MIVADLAVNVELRVNDTPVSLWRARLLCRIASMLGVPLLGKVESVR